MQECLSTNAKKMCSQKPVILVLIPNIRPDNRLPPGVFPNTHTFVHVYSFYVVYILDGYTS